MNILVTTGAIRGTCRECPYKELGLDVLSARWWYRRRFSIHKITRHQYTWKGITPVYLKSILFKSHQPKELWTISTRRNIIQIPLFRTKVFRSIFFPYGISKWNKLIPEIQSFESYGKFKDSILSFILTKENLIFAEHDVVSLK